jgi:hypothetical protein
VIVEGRNFTPNAIVQVTATNCSGPSTTPLPPGQADSAGEFTTWGECNCGGSTMVTAVEPFGTPAFGSAQIPC